MTIYYGMAQWQHPGWVNWLYPSSLPAAERLSRYAEVFSAVEVGSSFYTKIGSEQLQRWYMAVPDSFRFSFKAPQAVTHRLFDRPWDELLKDWRIFIESLRPLLSKLGPTMLQFPATCDEQSLNRIISLCELWDLPSPLAVEVRHMSYFDKTDCESSFLSALSGGRINRVVMDSRPVFSTKPYCTSLIDAQKKKPRVPCHPIATSTHPVVRFIGHPDLPLNDKWLNQWAIKLSQWLSLGLVPTVFVHSSDNIAAPALASLLDQKVQNLCPSYQSRLQLPSYQEQKSLW